MIKYKGLDALNALRPPEPPAAVSARLDALLGAKDKNCTDAEAQAVFLRPLRDLAGWLSLVVLYWAAVSGAHPGRDGCRRHTILA